MKLSHIGIGLLILSFFMNNGLFAQTTFTDITEEAGIDHFFQVYEGTFGGGAVAFDINNRSEEHTSELQSLTNLV